MKTVGFIPIKLNNERAPGKNTKKFDDGRSLIEVFQQVLIDSKAFDELYVFCSDEEIKDFLLPNIVFIKRPRYLDRKEATPQDIISEFMKVIDSEVYAVCHCTSPFVTPEHIKECVDAVKSNKYDSAFTAERVQRLMWTDNNVPLNFEPGNIPRTQDLPVFYNEVSATYVFRKEVFEIYRSRIGKQPYITEVSGIEAIDIDYPDDFILANVIYMNLLRNNKK